MLEAKWIGPPSFRSGAFTMAPEHPPLRARRGPEYFSGQHRDSHASLQTLAAGVLPLYSTWIQQINVADDCFGFKRNY